jgi:hypothetical protein
MLTLLFYFAIILFSVWFLLFCFSLIHNKLLIMQGKEIKDPYELFKSIKKIRIKNFTINPFKLAFYAMF